MATHSAIGPDESTRALGRIIGAKASEVEQRWLRRVQTDIARTPGVELTELRDGIPDYLAALAVLLSEGGGDSPAANGTAIWSRVAREHGVTRVRIGFDIDQLIHEFIVLRREVRAVAAENGIATAATEGILADLIEAAIAEAVHAYIEARDHAARRVQAQNIGFLTHELRNPLATGVHAAERLREQASPEHVRALDALERSHRRLTELIDGVLDVERLEAGKIEPRKIEVREDKLLEQATEAARRVASEKGLGFETHVDPMRRIRVDPELTRSALQNLVDNAVKYTDAGGVDVATEETDTSWSVHVRDSCPGLSREELRTIFEPFRRGSTSKKGTGLGLAIARRAIEAQGGTIQAESPGDGGCHFWFTLPKT